MPIYLVKGLDSNRKYRSITVKATDIDMVKSGMEKRDFKVESIDEIDERQDKSPQMDDNQSTRFRNRDSFNQAGINLKDIIHPSENSMFILAVIASLPIMIVGILLIFVSLGGILLFVGIILLAVWFSLEVLKAILIGNSVKVSVDNFSQINEMLDDVKSLLGYKKSIDIYITAESSVNAFLYKFFQTKFILLNAGLVEEMLEGKHKKEMMFILGRFVGALKAKHFRLDILRILVNSIEKIAIFNLFLLPYERATQYTGDQIGLAICQDLDSALNAMNKLIVGNKLAKQVELRGILSQSIQAHTGFFGAFSTLLSTHPHLTSRYLNLLIFSKQKYPLLLDRYFSKIGEDIGSLFSLTIPNQLPRRNMFFLLVALVAFSIGMIILLMISITSLLLFFTEGTALAPFIYTLF